MSLEVEATYEHGMLKPAQALPLEEGQKVSLVFQPVGGAAQRFSEACAGPAIPKNCGVI